MIRADRLVFDHTVWISYFITRKEQQWVDLIAENDLTI